MAVKKLASLLVLLAMIMMMFGTSLSFQMEEGNKRIVSCCAACSYQCQGSTNPKCYIKCVRNNCGGPSQCFQLFNG